MSFPSPKHRVRVTYTGIPVSIAAGSFPSPKHDDEVRLGELEVRLGELGVRVSFSVLG